MQKILYHHQKSPNPECLKVVPWTLFLEPLKLRSRPTIANPSPFGLWRGRKPDVSHHRIFGEPGYVHIPKELRQKLDSKAELYHLVGYCWRSQGIQNAWFIGKQTQNNVWCLFSHSAKLSQLLAATISFHTLPLWPNMACMSVL
jgi:hypothetical protein